MTVYPFGKPAIYGGDPEKIAHSLLRPGLTPLDR
jgi:hypothetical protein